VNLISLRDVAEIKTPLPWVQRRQSSGRDGRRGWCDHGRGPRDHGRGGVIADGDGAITDGDGVITDGDGAIMESKGIFGKAVRRPLRGLVSVASLVPRLKAPEGGGYGSRAAYRRLGTRRIARARHGCLSSNPSASGDRTSALRPCRGQDA
jgi:hypothetical protein